MINPQKRKWIRKIMRDTRELIGSRLSSSAFKVTYDYKLDALTIAFRDGFEVTGSLAQGLATEAIAMAMDYAIHLSSEISGNSDNL